MGLFEMLQRAESFAPVFLLLLLVAACSPATSPIPTPTRPTATAMAVPTVAAVTPMLPTPTPVPATPKPAPTPIPKPAATATIARPQPTNSPVPPTVTPPPATVTPAPVSFSGKGQQAPPSFGLDEGLAIFRLKHSGLSNFAVWLLGSEGQKVELLVNTIGGFDGAKAVGIKQDGKYVMDVQADGSWEVSIEQPRPASATTLPAINGKGQKTSPLFALQSGLTIFRMTHDGKSNFALWLLNAKGQKVELLVNVIGQFNGSKALGVKAAGIYVLDITADGNWTIAAEQ